MKKILILLPIIFIVLLGCSEDKFLYEPEVTSNSIDLPFESKKNGKVSFIYRNNSADSIPITLAMAKQRAVLEDSQSFDFCPDIINLRNGIVNPDWFVVNFNIAIIPEISILNQNDHPNLVSYSFPMGTYVAFLMEAQGCNKEQYEVFDITSNDSVQIINE